MQKQPSPAFSPETLYSLGKHQETVDYNVNITTQINNKTIVYILYDQK